MIETEDTMMDRLWLFWHLYTHRGSARFNLAAWGKWVMWGRMP